MTNRNSKGAERAGAEKAGRLIAPGYAKEQREKRKAEDEEWASKSGPVTVRKKTVYDIPPASDGRGGPHPLAGVPQEVLDAATEELKNSAQLHGFEDYLDSDDIESIAHAILLVAVKVGAGLIEGQIRDQVAAQTEYDTNEELRKTHDSRDKGLESRYIVEKIHDPEGKHLECAYFVLDPQHDPLARDALLRYSIRARTEGYVQLSTDLDSWLAAVEESNGN